jgi:hypothetical protein
MKWNRCPRRQDVSLLAAGALGEEENIELERHLAACQECRSYYGEIKALTAPLTAWEKGLSAVEATPAARTRWEEAIGMAAKERMERKEGKLFGQDDRMKSGFLNPVNPGLPRRSLGGGWVNPVIILRVLLRSFAAKSSSRFGMKAVWRVVWRELIRPSRRAWSGMAALWVAMLVINGQLSDHRMSNAGARAGFSQEIMQSWEEQNRVVAELAQPAMFHSAPANPPLAPANPPRPRSERKQARQIV